MVFALPADEDGAAFIYRTSGEHVACEGFARAARKLFAVPQVAGEQFDFFKVFFHGFPLFSVPSKMNSLIPDTAQGN